MITFGVIAQRAGRKPLRSIPASREIPSVAAIAAGPSHGSVRKAWYS